MKKMFLLALMMLSGAANAAIQQGQDYDLLPAPQPVSNPRKVEVLEFFQYGCIHCLKLEPAMNAWLKKKPAFVEFKRVHVVWQKPMEGLARLYATEQATGTEPRLHADAFDAVMNKRMNLGDEAILAEWLKGRPGVNVPQFMQTYKSFGVNAEVARWTQATRDYSIEGTPTIVVGGKYALKTFGPEKLIPNMVEMIMKVKKEQNIR
ncbi:thiol:disulfide interchange protein DsbA/DsbL [Paludibacterium paludis]|uniref:Thiol:disulfide interchange protein n=1 Tax=Paludibacterium paludis TaxID=1225769 RepID=A0A918NZS1_9NEIS|nr:thiol:disulfide interchange protein DsbA/DsbL [Paludibacterium paludis]GGY08286.1 thiol:disulfide interchange protein [Paludibacterium paludis]